MEDGGNDDGDGMSQDQMLEFVKQIRLTADGIDTIINNIKGVSSHMSGDGQEGSATVSAGIKYAQVVHEMLDQLIRFLESPMGQRTRLLLWQYTDGIRAFVEIGAGAVLASFFLVVGQELLDLKDDDFRHARTSIEASIEFVERILPSIEERLDMAVRLLSTIRLEADEAEQTILKWNFGETVRLAKLDIEDCELKLKKTDEVIEKALVKITARIILSGVIKGAMLGVGGLAIYYVISRKMVTTSSGIAIGAVGLAVWALGLRKPYYRQLEKDFKDYKYNQESLHQELKRLKWRLQQHVVRLEGDHR